MRKIVCAGILLVVSVFVFATAGYANMYYDSPVPADLNDLDHSKAYYWGISRNLAANEYITSASISIKNINDWAIESTDFLYMDLFQDALYGTGVKTFTDNEAAGDYFANNISLFGTMNTLDIYSDTNEYREKKWNKKHTKYKWGPWINPSEDYTYNFSADEIQILANAMADGNFAFGFDPDCHYNNCGITFRFDTNVSTPEPATMSLLGLGLFGLLGFKRKK